MILDTIPLPSSDQRQSESAPARRPYNYRHGGAVSSAASKTAYARVGAQTAQQNQAAEPAAKPAKSFSLWENSSFGFGDFLDIINPLHHIPIVATLYRNMTGDQIGLAPRVIGGALWGRIGGLVAGLVNAAVEWFTGKDIGDHIYAAIRGGAADSAKNTAVVRSGDPPQSADEGSAGAGLGANGQRSILVSPALENSSDGQSPTDGTEITPMSSSSTALPPAYLLAAQAAFSRAGADAGGIGSQSARRHLRFTA